MKVSGRGQEGGLTGGCWERTWKRSDVQVDWTWEAQGGSPRASAGLGKE